MFDTGCPGQMPHEDHDRFDSVPTHGPTPDPTWSLRYAAHAGSPPLPALVSRDGAVTFAELTSLAVATSAWLDEAGVSPGRAVAALVSNGSPAAALTVAGAVTGRPLAPLHMASTASEVAIVLEQLEPAVLVAESTAGELATEAGARSGIPVLMLEERTASSGTADLDFTAPKPADVAAVLHTSGTTSAPKPVPYPHGRLAERVRVNSGLLGLGPGGRYGTASPFNHAAGIGNLLVSLGSGAAMVALQRFGNHTWQEIVDLGVTHLTLVPTMIDRLLSHGTLDPGELRLLQYGGSAIRSETVERLLVTLPDVELVQLYGQTEATPVTALTMADHRRATHGSQSHLLETAGRPIEGVDLVLDATDDAGVGEIVARGAHLMLPDGDGWVRTGDLASIDSEGYVTIIGRKGDMIIPRGRERLPRRDRGSRRPASGRRRGGRGREASPRPRPRRHRAPRG